MTKRKAKAWRGYMRQPSDCVGLIVEELSLQPGLSANCTVLPDGAAPPRDRKRDRAVRAARAVYEQYPFCGRAFDELEAALMALDGGRK